MVNPKLQKIVHRAKQLRKTHPGKKWTDLIKIASAELNKGSIVHHKKVSGMKPKTTKKAPGKKVVIIAGTKRNTTREHRGRVSGLKAHNKPMDVAKMLLGSIAGGSIGAIIYNKVPGSNMVKGLAQLAVGAGGMMIIPEKNALLFGLATGIGTGGGVNLLHTTGVMHGIDEMVSGLFDTLNGGEEMNGTDYEPRVIPAQTAGHHRSDGRNIHTADYVSGTVYTAADIDRWVTEGVPGIGAD